jgi:uncharacterized membrane protein
MAKPGLLQVIANTAHDFNPPLYYILLHFWILLVGRWDEGLKILSLLFHLGGVYVTYLLARKLFSEKFAWFAAAFYFFNPMLLYYGFEVRMYSLYAFLTVCMVYFFVQKQWKGFIISSILGLYTHSYFLMAYGSLLIIYGLSHRRHKINWIRLLIPFFAFLPWIPVIVIQFIRSKGSWLFPVDFQLIKSVLGNLFTNYEGTPGGFWFLTTGISLIIVLFLVHLWIKGRSQRSMYFVPIFLPLLCILGYSLIRQPLYVNRYLIFITVFEIFAIVNSIFLIQRPWIRKSMMVLSLLGIIGFDVWIAPYHKKTDFRTPFNEINAIANTNDVIFTKTPIGQLESAFYFNDPNRVYVYNPNQTGIPNYIGVTVVFPDSSRDSFPPPPGRTFLVDDNANYEMVITKPNL